MPPSLEESLEDGSLGLIIVDMQPRFLKTADNARELVKTTHALVNYFSSHGLPAVSVEGEGVITDREKTCTPLRWALSAHSEPKYIRKRDPDGFSGTGLADYLDERDIRRTLISGLYASFCIRETAKGAMRSGFGVSTSPELVADPMGMSLNVWDWYKGKGIYSPENDEIVEMMLADGSRGEQNLYKRIKVFLEG